MYKKAFFLFCILLQDGFAIDNLRYVDTTEFPYHVSVEKCGRHACSGVLVHESWVLTVASCVYGEHPSLVTVRARSSRLSRGGEKMLVSHIVVHEEFNHYLWINDIALIKLMVPAQFGERLLPIEIPEQTDDKLDNGEICTSTGWRFNLHGPMEYRLTAIDVPLVDHKICTSMMPSYEPMSDKLICAGYMMPGVLACQGDPGAPLVQNRGLIGLLSYGLGCKTMIHPGVYTRVGSYRNWTLANSDIRYTEDDIRETTMSTSVTFTRNTPQDFEPPPADFKV